VRNDHLAAGEQRADDRCAHAQVVVMVFRETVDPPIPEVHGGLQAVRLVGELGVDAVRPREIRRLL
jgi:hypothetical protein